MRRTNTIKIRLTDEEFAEVKAMGKPIGGVSALVRKRVLAQGVPPLKKEVIRELARVGVALNLVARSVSDRRPIERIEILAVLMTLDRDIQTIGRKLLKS